MASRSFVLRESLEKLVTISVSPLRNHQSVLSSWGRENFDPEILSTKNGVTPFWLGGVLLACGVLPLGGDAGLADGCAASFLPGRRLHGLLGGPRGPLRLLAVCCGLWQFFARADRLSGEDRSSCLLRASSSHTICAAGWERAPGSGYT